MSFGLDMSALRPDVYMDEESKAKFRSAFTPPPIKVILEQAELGRLICVLRSMAMDLRRARGLSPYSAMRNIQPIDCDELANWFDAIATNLGNRFGILEHPTTNKEKQ